MVKAFLDYLAGVRAEMTHVAWPKHMQAVGYTALVIGISLVVAVFLAFLDYALTMSLERFIIY